MLAPNANEGTGFVALKPARSASTRETSISVGLSALGCVILPVNSLELMFRVRDTDRLGLFARGTLKILAREVPKRAEPNASKTPATFSVMPSILIDPEKAPVLCTVTLM